ncbi:hypothetical protein [Couchioplanes azureus]|uniref:hypothetical protein n=1 Tax=Couchioplanes caeruleus TaxID=56438 RepID=UPI00167100AB|nr:hypothetical protein [Couchioplanes caeruleus]GGQ70062.1 hypothetical protein GCM10010166_44870 [Couchioplanes caeruleus subsp. azureus]
MALALLDLVSDDDTGVGLDIDTGTNTHYRLKVGRKVRRSDGIDWVDDVYFDSGTGRTDGEPFRPPVRLVVPASALDPRGAYAQLFTAKGAAGLAAAHSRVVPLRRGGWSVPMSTAYGQPRRVACRTAQQEYARPASLGDLLGQILKIAAPVAVKLMGPGTSPPGPADPQTDMLAGLIRSLLGALTGAPAALPAPPPAAVPASAPAAVPASAPAALPAPGILRPAKSLEGNRFARPLIFGIDDAAIATLLGPIIKIIPDLLNSANQNRLQLRQANNKLVTDILSEVNRRLLLNQVLEARAQAPAQGAELEALARLLQQAGVATAQSVPPLLTGIPGVSRQAVLTFVTADPVTWNGKPYPVFAHGRPVRLRVRLDVTGTPPKGPLPRAILTVTLKRPGDEAVLHRTTARLRDVVAGTELAAELSAVETARLPTDSPLVACAELRWRGRTGENVYRAYGSAELVLVSGWFLQSRGDADADERELTDLVRFRDFWHKVWESPAAAGGKRLWELDVTARYTFLIATDQDTNGLMETRIQRVADDLDGVTESVTGRLKSGIELSPVTLNGLLPQWSGGVPLDESRLSAFRTARFARDNAVEFVRPVRFRGRHGERGAVWVGAVLRRVAFTLASAAGTDENGQVTNLMTETARFPMPVAARLLALKARQ